MTGQPAENLVQISGLWKNRGAGYCLRIPRLTIRTGDKIILLGGSGSGKSTCLDILALVLKPDGVREFVWRLGTAAVRISEVWDRGRADLLARLRLAGLGYVLQTGGLLPFLSVRDNILLPAALQKIPPGEQRRRLDQLYQALGIGHLDRKYPAEISVGERQRCAIARAIIHRPALILADEPTASLDPPTADRVFELLLSLSRQSALVVATHDLSRARRHNLTTFKIDCPPPTAPGRPLEAELTIENPRPAE